MSSKAENRCVCSSLSIGDISITSKSRLRRLIGAFSADGVKAPVMRAMVARQLECGGDGLGFRKGANVLHGCF